MANTKQNKKSYSIVLLTPFMNGILRNSKKQDDCIITLKIATHTTNSIQLLNYEEITRQDKISKQEQERRKMAKIREIRALSTQKAKTPFSSNSKLNINERAII